MKNDKLTELEERILTLVQEERDIRSNELFGKPESLLMISEIQLLDEYINDLKNPQWKSIYINGKESKYKISNIGKVSDQFGNILSTYTADQKKYIYVSLTVNKIQYRKTVHRLVATAFIENPENKKEVNHINGNKHLNWYRNLEWSTRQENADHARESGLMLTGSNAVQAKRTEHDAHEVCKLIEQGLGSRDIANKLDLPHTFVVGIMYRGEWADVSKNYNIPKAKSFADENIIHEICKRLQNGDKIKSIAEELNINRKLIDTIKYGEAHRAISNLYDIPGLEKVEVRDKLSSKIYKLLNDGIMDTDEIIRILNMESTKGKKQYIAKIRKRFRKAKQVESSTTIDQL